MNREIKFRAWNKEKRMWYFDWFDSSSIGILSVNWVNPVIMQFTGLKDKNGKEIYEGDILSHKYYDAPVVVTFENGAFQFGDVAINDKSIEIIGNIYENPELVKK